MRRYLLIAMTFAVSLLGATTAAQAVVLDTNQSGTSVPYSSSNQSGYVGVALVPGTRGNLSSTNIPTVTSSAPCTDPALSSDLTLPDTGICSHGGRVIGGNETFAFTWDQKRRYWAGTRGYVEQFLRDVADGSGTLSSPYAVTPQYSDASGRAANSSIYGGGCIDFGAVGGSACEFGSPTGAGHDYPANGCTPTGTSFDTTTNDVCLTDAQLQGEVQTMVTQTGVLGHTQTGHSPLVVLLTPPGVEACLDAAAHLCSANSKIAPPAPSVSTAASGGTIPAGVYNVKVTYVTGSGETLASESQSVTTTGTTSTITISSPPPASGATGWYAYVTQAGGTTFTRQQPPGTPTAVGTDLTLSAPPTNTGALVNTSTAPSFCSYHSQVNVGGTEVAYVVQPWTPNTSCDEPNLQPLPSSPTPAELATFAGIRLVGPLSQGQIASVVNPGLNGWFALDGSEINDNGGCRPLGPQFDNVTVGNGSQNPYPLQREFNNAGVIESEPNTYFGCAPNVLLSPTFVVPSDVNQGDVVQFDGSTTASTLIVPNAGYAWDFGDGTGASGPSVVHSYTTGGTYSVKLTTTDRGGYVRSLTQTIIVLGANGLPVPPATTPTSTGPGGGAPGGGETNSPAFQVRLQLLPQGLRSVLRLGVAVQVSSNQAANGITRVSISRATARRAHIKAGRGPSVVIGVGTVSGIKDGSVTLHLRLSRVMRTKLKHLRHLTLTVRLALVAAGGHHLAIVAAGRY